MNKKLQQKIYSHIFNTGDCILAVSDFLENFKGTNCENEEIQIDFNNEIVVLTIDAEFDKYTTNVSILKATLIDEDNNDFFLTDEEIAEIGGIYEL